MGSVHWTQDAPGTRHPADAWWQTLVQAECLRTDVRRVVVHVARSARGEIVVETARALITFLRRAGVVTVDVIDPGGRVADWPNVGWIDLAATERLRVDAACVRGGAMVPTLWLDDFYFVTVTGIAPDPRYGLSGILAAQAALLPESGIDDLGVIFEAHRLLAADLNIACGTRIAGSPASETWWAASRDDVRLECAIAAAAGASPMTLPHLHYLSRHEVMPTSSGLMERHIALENHVASVEAVRAARTRAAITRVARMIREDIGLAAANLHRIPQFIERRWPGVLPFGKGAA